MLLLVDIYFGQGCHQSFKDRMMGDTLRLRGTLARIIAGPSTEPLDPRGVKVHFYGTTDDDEHDVLVRIKVPHSKALDEVKAGVAKSLQQVILDIVFDPKEQPKLFLWLELNNAVALP